MMRAFPAAGDVFGDYVVDRELGRGAMGIVYLAHQPSLERQVALKLLSPALDQPEFRKRFNREALTLAKLNSPYIVSIYEYGEEDGWLYLTNPYLPAGDLQGRIEARPFGPDEAMRLVGQLATGLATAHQLGIVHRDLKPSNILLSEELDGLRALLADFGIARVQGIDSTLTGGAVIGTLPYMPPERHSGSVATPAGDVYALGCVLWAMLHQRPPFVTDSGMLLMRELLQGPPPEYGGPQAEQINAILWRCLATNPEDRFADAIELRMALLHQDGPAPPPAPELTVLATRPPTRPPPNPPPPHPRTEKAPNPLPPRPPDPDLPPPRRGLKLVIGAILLALCVVAVPVIIKIVQDGDPGSGSDGTTASDGTTVSDDAMLNAPPVGSCYNLRADQMEAERVPDAEMVPCTGRHTSRTVGVVEVPPDSDSDQHEVACFEEALRFLDSEPVLFIRSLLNLGTYTPLRSDVEAGASWVRCDVHMGSVAETRLPDQVKPAGFQSGILDPTVDWCLRKDGASVPCSEPHDYNVSGVPEADSPTSFPGEGEAAALADAMCPEPLQSYYPSTPPIWEAGYRYLICWA